MTRARSAWLLWCAIALGLFNTCATHRERVEVEHAFAAHRVDAGVALQAARAAGTDDGDIARYFAYANAILGRPYAAYYVRPAAGWRADDIANDPENSPIATSKPLAPYRDFSVEYPPGFFAFALPPALICSSSAGYALAFSLWMGLLLTAALWLCTRAAPRLNIDGAELVRLSAVAVLALGVICVRRFDACVALSVCGLAVGVVTRRPWLAGVLCGLGIAAKGVPLVAVPFPIIIYVLERRWRELAIASAAALLVVGAIVVPFLDAPLGDILRYHGERPIQVESIWGGLLALIGSVTPVTVRFTYGSLNISAAFDAPLRVLASIAPIGAWLGLVVHAIRIRITERGLIRFIVAALVAYMVLGKVFSPQYMTWLVPLGAVASLTAGRTERRLYLAAMLATQIIYPFLYLTALPWTGSPLFGAAVLVRDGILAAWAVRLVRAA